mmetsp:Transcript_38045/g.55877  ORF Transcript_38045/g.55877 Transcript_38045/m.55877 type:complete len:88 (-) Transcript_38045:579-842(-)
MPNARVKALLLLLNEILSRANLPDSASGEILGMVRELYSLILVSVAEREQTCMYPKTAEPYPDSLAAAVVLWVDSDRQMWSWFQKDQ